MEIGEELSGLMVMLNEQQQRANSAVVGDPLAHDLRHALYALRTGVEILPQIRDNVAEFDEIHRLLLKELENASALANRLLQERPPRD